MHLSTTSLLACLAGLALGDSRKPGDNGNSTGTLRVDAIFPRNESYAFSPNMPFVFAFRNTGLVRYIVPEINFELRSVRLNKSYATTWTDGIDQISEAEPYFLYDSFNFFNETDTWTLNWSLTYTSCSKDAQAAVSSQTEGGSVVFSMHSDPKPLDLAAALRSPPAGKHGADSCADSAGGVALDVPTLVDRPANVTDIFNRGKCAVVASSTTVSAADRACPVQVDEDAASSMAAFVESHTCLGYEKLTFGCQKNISAAAPHIVSMTGVLAAALGGLAFLVML